MSEVWSKYLCIKYRKLIIFNHGFYAINNHAFLIKEKIKELSGLKLLNLEERQNLSHILSDKGFAFKGTIVTLTLPSLPGGSLEISRTIPLRDGNCWTEETYFHWFKDHDKTIHKIFYSRISVSVVFDNNC